MKTGRLLALLAGGVLALSGCAGGDGAAPIASAGPGVIQMVVNAPDDSTGSLVLSLTGGPVDSVVPGSGLYGDGTTLRAGATLFVTGAITRNMVVGSVYVPDVAAPYTVSVTDAANGTTNVARTGAVRVQLSR